ncbi:NTPase KAP [Mesorhizobium sp. M2D.F.Ca.ET.185.01.1.1]|nr:NTPase KAP [Mesorhizobium sp. M2D.F.Ca.ET.232.01.1.1]TGP53479.1 NTPase KAP [Mesorhizobium sp. M2D.F.Ca.ET.226.01.1.1]TGP62366.1 NTPase KAP [Mesorhizobium sp. M2D.F.Ca.ET.225.01.1.1]TGP74300.1 NTPase KAP [bacterium M00.F.Ca.ET.227.01.1.1]TGQ25657.1 NTPase KAP [Mesorhizobium sp. M00.F.Ca.ET.220.01.1.1]TGQ82767.1 NTPase KAP [Mesorhizobium sp. M2D.F.Ca.ET.206.01.1.1]TGS26647.1 NTPase KAP [Mesorhizobium sp. M2D.F.Ca.ET.185.01.1.1]TGS91312.1 NTPase KAP [Mesorhizobium sp. M2D.F.Ca.ET.178.01.1.1]
MKGVYLFRRVGGECMIVADNETAVDFLYYEPIAKTVAGLIRARSGDPLTIGLHGDWGAGKSSALLMIEAAFSGDKRTLCVRFNGWAFEGYDDAKAVLIETIVSELLAKRTLTTKVKEKAAAVLKNVDWFKVARTAGGAALTLLTGIPAGGLLEGVASAAKQLISNPGEVLTGEMLNRVLDGASAHLKSNSSTGETTPQRMHEFRKDFEELLEAADIDRLVVLIDDLDRCLPATAIATLEAVRLFLFVPRAAFVVAADEGMIEYAVRNHFPDLPASQGSGSYARNYLEKLIQVPFRMPPLGSVETRIYLTLLLALSSGLKEDEFKKVLPIARDALQRPWLDKGFDRAKIATALNPIPSQLEAGIQLAAEITPMLAEGARGNPRQVKRFVNTLTLRLAIADERKFRDEIKETVLAKLMLAERFAPEVFDAIALELDANGHSKTVAALEALASGSPPDTAKSSGKKKPVDIAESLGKDWPNIEWAKRWAGIRFPLAGIDLRPYFFVSRDRRAALASVLAAGPVEEMVERLSASSLGAKSVAVSELSGLTSVDAERIFHALAAKVDTADDLSKRPIAADGLAALCNTRPELRPPLIALLDRLPAANIGGWVTTGWGSSVTGPQAAAFKGLLEKWRDSGNKPLSAVAKMELDTPLKAKH